MYFSESCLLSWQILPCAMSLNHVSASTKHLPKSHFFLYCVADYCYVLSHADSFLHQHARLSYLLTQNPSVLWTVLTMQSLMQKADGIQITEKTISLSLLFCQSIEACEPELVSKDLALLGRNAFLRHLPLLGAGEINQCISVVWAGLYLFKH